MGRDEADWVLLADRYLLCLLSRWPLCREKSSESDSEDKSELLLLRHSLNIDRSCKGPPPLPLRRDPFPIKTQVVECIYVFKGISLLFISR